MKILCLLVLTCVLASALAQKPKFSCTGKPRGNIEQINSRTNSVAFPCKYYALKRQRCGKYLLTFSPGQLWLGTNYYLNTFWLGVNDTELGKGWDGRTTNKILVKYFNSGGTRALFNKKRGELFTKDVFDFGLDKKKPSSYIKDKAGNFKITLTPWDPSNRQKYGHPSYKFECFTESPYQEYPAQVCGGMNKTFRVASIADEVYDIPDAHRAMVIYHDVFMSDVEQTDPECIEAADIMQNLCPDFERRKLALKNCMDILLRSRHTECVTKFQCTPMQAFNACMKWGCTGVGFEKQQVDQCIAVGEAIDLCGNITGFGNISDRMRDARCFKDYLAITYDSASVVS